MREVLRAKSIYKGEEQKGSTARFGKEAQRKILCQIKVSKPEEYCMYFPVWKLPSWCKRFAVTRRRNRAVLPQNTSEVTKHG